MTKLAAHIQESSDAAAEHLRMALYPAIKCMGNVTPAWLREKVLPEYDQCGVPRPFIWRRKWVDVDEQKGWVLEGIAGAHKFFERTAPEYDAWRGLTDVVESVNEFIPWREDDMRRLCEFESELVRLFHLHGNRIIVGNFSVGWPQLEHWPFYSATLAHADFLGLHEYAWPEGVAGDDGVAFLWHPWRVMRYKKARQVMLSHGMRLPPIILTEIGWDRAVWQTGHTVHGFRGAPDPNAYYAWLTGYDARVIPDSDVLYTSVFQTGATADWRAKGFDIVGHYVGNCLADYTRVAALQHPQPPQSPIVPSTGKLTDAERARVREFFATAVPATLKDAIARGREFVGEVPGSPNLYVSWDPAMARYEINKVHPELWTHLDDEPL
ncbi:MAG TPA: hypothetical protein VM537_06325 [Anaerolineae bacterium]|nr:hypothetical protein [Anaerolineae bacterium]